MSKKNEVPTQSEQYDQKLRSELYTAMLEMQEISADLHEEEEANNEDGVEICILKLLDLVPEAVNAYFMVVEKGNGHV